jgi:dimethylhistidine N-methyltransferase
MELIELTDFHPDTMGWYDEVLTGLQQPEKMLPAKLFYDEAGSKLFDQITELPEYYPTRTEQAIMDSVIDEIAALLPDGTLLVEYGSGSSQKTRTLLDHLPNLAGYVPIDISKEFLLETAVSLAAAYPHLNILPVCADYEAEYELPIPSKNVTHTVAYYPGSTIGNFHPEDAVAFLKHMREICGDNCGLLIGVDLKKDKNLLIAAYNDRAGITGDFNLNALARLNRELGASFDLNTFQHVAFYNETAGRIEMHLRSLCQQRIRVNGLTVDFAAGECIWTESSYKYTIPEFQTLTAKAGFNAVKTWTDENNLFSVHYFVAK